MHHKKGWVNRRKERFFRVKFRFELGKINKRCKTIYAPESMVHFVIQKLGEKYKDEQA